MTVGCAKEVRVENPSGKEADGKAQLEFRLGMPDFMSRTRAATTYLSEGVENYVYELMVLVMTEDGTGGWEFAYAVDAEDASPDSAVPQIYNASLEVSDEPVKLIVMANVSERYGFMDNLPPEGTPEADVRKHFVAEIPTGFRNGADWMPMSGEAIVPVLKDIYNDPIHISLLRSVAKIHITKNLDPGSTPFTITGVQVHNFSTAVQVLPNAEAMNAEAEIIAPSLPASLSAYAGTPDELIVNDEPTGLEFYYPLYIAESEDKTTTEAACVIIYGYWNNSTMTFYRIDFNPGEDPRLPSRTGEIIRNRQYNLNIRKVFGMGYDMVDTALENPANSSVIDAEWFDSFDHLWFSLDTPGGREDVAVMLNPEITVGPNIMDQSLEYDIHSTREFTWWLEGSNDPTNQVQQNNEYVMAQMLPLPAGTTLYDKRIFITAMQTNDTGAPRSGKIYFSFLDGAVGGSVTWIQQSN